MFNSKTKKKKVMNKKVMNKKVMNKKVMLKSTIMLLLTALLTGCASTKLSEAFQEEEVSAQGKAVVEELVNGKYEDVCARMSELLKASLTADVLKTHMDTMNAATGAYQEIKSTSVIGQTDAKTKQEIAVAVIVASFEKRKVTYTISFDTDMKLIGLYMK